MAGRHGKLSGSPFHVINCRDLAAEKYGEHFRGKITPCKYRTRSMTCGLPQNKKRYTKNCVPQGCSYLDDTCSRKRNSCANLVHNKCIYKKFSNCTQIEDLAYCCDYYSSDPMVAKKNKKMQEYISLLENTNNRIKTLSNKQRHFMQIIKPIKRISEEEYFLFLEKVENTQVANIKNGILPNVLTSKNTTKEMKNTYCILSQIEASFEAFYEIVKENREWFLKYENVDVSSLEDGFKKFRMASTRYMEFLKQNF